MWNLSRQGITPSTCSHLGRQILAYCTTREVFSFIDFSVLYVCWRRSFALKHLCVLLYLCGCVHLVPSPDLENSQLLFLYTSDPFSLSSAFETPSIHLTCSSRVRSFSENIFIKKKFLVLSSHLPESFYLWTHYLSTPSTSSALQFILHLIYWVL